MARDCSLLPVWVVGFTGHRQLEDAPKVAELLRQLIDSLKAETPGQIIGYSSVAIGADTLFVEACLAKDIQWTAVLPRPEQDFKDDFNDLEWKKTSQLLKRAARVECLPAVRDRDLAYLECGLSTVEEADVMIAVWDGQPSRGTGGTAEVVAHTRTLGKPLIIIDPSNLQVQREGFSPHLFSDQEMTYLNQIPSRDRIATDEGEGPEDRVRRFFRKVDAYASRIAPRVRRWIGASVIMNAIAAILTAAAITFALHSKVIDAAIFLLVAAATLSVALIKRKKAHRKWLRSRAAAEICRSALATWELDDFPAPFWLSQLEGLMRLAKSIRLLRWHARNKGPVDLEEWRRNYLKIRVDEQLHYFRRRCRRLALAAGIFTGAFWIFSVLGLARSLIAFIFRHENNPVLIEALHSFLPIALPLAAGCALSLISIFDLGRQLARARAVEAQLKQIRTQIENCRNMPSLRHAVEHAENAFAAEVFEWFTLFKYPRFY